MLKTKRRTQYRVIWNGWLNMCDINVYPMFRYQSDTDATMGNVAAMCCLRFIRRFYLQEILIWKTCALRIHFFLESDQVCATLGLQSIPKLWYKPALGQGASPPEKTQPLWEGFLKKFVKFIIDGVSNVLLRYMLCTYIWNHLKEAVKTTITPSNIMMGCPHLSPDIWWTSV